MNTALLTPLTAGELSLKNRVVMAPLTRVRAGAVHAVGGGAEGYTDYPFLAG